MTIQLKELEDAALSDLTNFIDKINTRKGDRYIIEIHRIAKEMTDAKLRLDVTLITRFGQETMYNLEPSSAIKMVLTLMQRTGLEFKIEYST